MFKPIDRYLLKELIPPFLLGLLVYTFVLLMNQILLLSELFIARGVPLPTILQLMAELLPSVLAFTLPMAVLMGILAGLSRLSTDSEIIAFKTLGISYTRLLRPIFMFALIGWVITALFTMYLAPWGNYQWVKTLSSSVLARAQIQMKPREFNEAIPQLVLYIQDINQLGEWQNIFLYSTKKPEEPQLVLAKRGQFIILEEKNKAILRLFKGTIHSFPLTDPEKYYRLTSFSLYEEEIDISNLIPQISPEKRVREKTIPELRQDITKLKEEINLMKKNRTLLVRAKERTYRTHLVEFNKKMALPFACLVFALLGLPLGASTRKGGRTSGFTLSLIIIIGYYVLITAGEKMAVDGQIAPWVGMWGANIILAIMGLFLFWGALREVSYQFIRKKVDLEIEPGKITPIEIKRWKLFARLPQGRLWSILDHYIVRRFFWLFMLIFLALLILFVIITFFERIDRVYEHQKPLYLFLQYIWFRLPEFIHYVLPMAALTATLLTYGLMSKFNEVTAAKACGISLYRLVVPLVILGVLISAVSFYLQESILPAANKKQEQLWNMINDLPPRTYTQVDQRWIMSQSGRKMYYYRYFDPLAAAFSQIMIFEFKAESWSLKRQWAARRAVLKGQKLLLSRGWVREFKDEGATSFQEFERVAISPVEDKSYFIKERKVPEQMTFKELKRYIREIRAQGFSTRRFEVDLQSKLAFPLACLVMVLLALPFAFSMGRRGALVGLGISVIIAMIYWGAIGIFRGLGYIGYLSPFLAAWSPPFLFGALALYLLFSLRS
ncbi:LPS export ABC transporter permease LptF [Candidatus Aminicenantes bacterium AC-334-K16]|nr:LPS export ABC transporter permease LptF [Candidatus Aminicenantes bacterium AC-334-K16]